MPTKKKQGLKKTYKLKHRRRNSSHYFKGGTCSTCGNCMQSTPSIFSGGKNSYKSHSGGNDQLPPSYNGLPLRYVYSQNTYNHDPSAPSSTTSSRLSNNVGGTRRRNKRPKKGGSMIFSYLNGQMGSSTGFNAVAITGESSGSTIHSNILSGDVGSSSVQNPSVFSQPVDTKYNIYNRPLA